MERKIINQPISPLELFLPDGFARRSCVVGSNCPARLLPEQKDLQPGQIDLVILAPRASECQAPGWLRAKVRLLDQQVVEKGIIYVISPLQWRAKVLRLLKDHGWSSEISIIHLPDWESSQYLVPLDITPARYAFSNLIPTRPLRRRLVLTLLQLPRGKKLLERILPPVGFVLKRYDQQSLFIWLFKNNDNRQNHSGKLIISASWRGRQDSLVVHGFANGSSPSVVAKLPGRTNNSFNPTIEFENLKNMGNGARTSRVQIPKPLSRIQLGNQRAFLQSAVQGQSVAIYLTGKPDRLIGVLEQVVSWLEAWNRSTRVIRRMDRAQWNHKLLALAESIAPFLPKGPEYYAWLVERCMHIHIPVPLFAAHNDLTMWNILRCDEEQLGIVDWEAELPECLPLADFFYMILDGVFLAHRLKDRSKACEMCFSPGGRYSDLFTRLLKRLRQMLDIPEEVVDLSLHACFISHAWNEVQRGEQFPSPFLGIVHWLAEHRSAVREYLLDRASGPPISGV